MMDYKVVTANLSGNNSTNLRTVYTTEYPCMLFVEVKPGLLPGYFGRQNCYFDINYTGNASYQVRTYLWGDTIGTGENAFNVGGTRVGYCPRAGVPVVFNTNDDDYGGSVRIHIMRLPSI